MTIAQLGDYFNNDPKESKIALDLDCIFESDQFKTDFLNKNCLQLQCSDIKSFYEQMKSMSQQMYDEAEKMMAKDDSFNHYLLYFLNAVSFCNLLNDARKKNINVLVLGANPVFFSILIFFKSYF